MTTKLLLQLGNASLEFQVCRVLVAGYTGRDQNQVRAHIAELERQGIPAPPSVPMVYPLDSSWATTETDLAISQPRVSGEAEPALLLAGESLEDAFVSVIVDFTDREEERHSIPRAKLQPKPFSAQVWAYKEVASVWDDIALRSWVEPGPEREFYQSGKFSQLLPPPVLLEHLKPHFNGGMAGTVVLMGTLPLRTKEFQFTDYFACEAETPSGLKLSYQCKLRNTANIQKGR